MKSKDNIKKKRIMLLFIAILLIAFTSCSREKEEQIPDETSETNVAESEIEQTTETETNAAATEEVIQIYPEPEYTFNIEEVIVKIPGLTKEYTLAWVSDLHIIADVPFTEFCEDVEPEHYETVEDRYENIFVTEEGIHAAELWPEIVKWLNAQELDGVILGGDLIDYYSVANMAAFREEYNRIRFPVLYIRADHDYGVWYHADPIYGLNAFDEHIALDGDGWGNQHFFFEEFSVIGINESQRSLSKDLWARIEPELENNKPVILATHVPYGSEVDTSLYELSIAERGREYYWPSESYTPYQAQPHMIETIKDPDTFIEQIVAGHLHASWDGMLNEQVKEHIFGPAYAGNVGIIRIVGE